jgi:microcystin degradation protein MlrC
VALQDTADNQFSGGVADAPGLLAAIRAARLTVPACFAFLHDPPAVAAASRIGIGGRGRFNLGEQTGPAFGAPIPVAAKARHLAEGRFINLGPMERRAPVDVRRG